MPIVITKREWEIGQHLIHGLTNAQIARKLGISPATMKNHIASILRKAQALNRTELAVIISTRTIEVENHSHSGASVKTAGAIEYESWSRVLPTQLTLWLAKQNDGEEEYISWYFLKGGARFEPYCWYDETDDRAVFNPDEVSDIPQEHKIIPLYK